MFRVQKSEFETIMLENVRRERRIRAIAFPQKTLVRPVVIDGIGLHSGAAIHMVLHPAEADRGVVFRRTDLVAQGREVSDIPATFDHVVDTTLSTAIGNAAGTTVSTVEHLMSAFSALGIDNALVEIDGPEVPVLDGSSEIFIDAIEGVGIEKLDAPRKAIRILKPVIVEDGAKRAALLPGDGFRVSFEIDFDNPLIGRQALEVDLHDDFFVEDIMRARTFCLRRDIEAMWAAGLAKGGSLDNAVVVDQDRILNEEGLRYEDEFVRHKVLDAVGDLALSGRPLIGRYEGSRAGHAMNNRVLRALMADRSAWEVVDFTDASSAAHSGPELVAIPAD
ncbi:UDP-3-0-acyl N-acetylglucosamine deacetylase [Parvibaculum lavamentivorans DS-1]|uniref:UDP-3-O-acyl-N-acetylglucosamine deacetylase n=1 Tax=Parvibaculum lavamentivorans (strain DS-1 / DSM 13023 / NCIMB 13966) TaxID=402881 RepID=A7HVV5_PARL1|nr:UDP-3-0-acyl N-acetylglucosamine deacetylase [Parvibaculum lavamentivorans DS-1]